MTNEELYHHGILGQKWGVRRYQNPDGSLTPEGRKRYGSVEVANAHAAYKSANKQYGKSYDDFYKTGHKLSSYTTKKGKADYDVKTKKMLDDADEVAKTRAAYKSAKESYKRQKKYEAAEEKAAKQKAAVDLQTNAIKSKIDREVELVKARDKISDSTSALEKVVFSSATREKAAKYVVDNNMSVNDAKKKANRQAIKNTATMLAVVGGVTLLVNKSDTVQTIKNGVNDTLNSDAYKRAWRAGMNR